MSAGTVVRRRCSGVGAVFGFALTLIAVAACGTESSLSAAPLVARLATAPVPEGAVKMSGQDSAGDFERGPSASVEYSLAAPLEAACADLLAAYLEAGYSVTEYSDGPTAITDPDTWCAAQLEVSPEASVASIVVIAYPPGVGPGHPSDGLYAVLTTAKAGDVHPDGTHLRLSAQ